MASGNNSKSTAQAEVRQVIKIMRDVFEPEQLREIVECLEGEGHCCELFDGYEQISDILSNPRTKLLLTGALEDDLVPLVTALHQSAGNFRKIPVLVYLQKPVSGEDEKWLLTAVDDFILKPLNLKSLLLRVRLLEHGVKESELEIEQTKKNLVHHFGMRQFIGEAPSFLAIIEKIPRVAACNVTVLLTGETGTGKEMCARAIHYMSDRANKPFVPINCGSIPTELFENELFGHEPGAFTDARQSRRGMIAEAEGGTLFLDEVDSLPLPVQVKLLRLLQERQYRPLGGQYRKADIRVIAATNQNLRAKLQVGAFREDLFYRLKVVTLHLPQLRDRREDILPLANYFLRGSCQEYNRPMKEFSAGATQKLRAHTWSGNVRELENVVHQAVVMVSATIIRARDLQLTSEFPESSEMPAGESFKVAKARVIEEFERTYLEETLVSCEGNISKAARRARKDRRSFFALLKKYDLAPNHSGERKVSG